MNRVAAYMCTNCGDCIGAMPIDWDEDSTHSAEIRTYCEAEKIVPPCWNHEEDTCCQDDPEIPSLLRKLCTIVLPMRDFIYVEEIDESGG